MHALTTRARAERWLAQRPAPKPRRYRPGLGWLLLMLLACVLLTDAEKGEPAQWPRPAHRRAETYCLLGLSLLLALAALAH